jgi:SNF2 family DNA or RNA helicase
MTPTQMVQYKQFEKDKILEIYGQTLTAANGAALSNKLLQWANGATYYDLEGRYVETHSNKVDALIELIEQAGDNPVLCAYIYKHDLYRIVAELKKQFPNKRLALLKDDKDVEAWNNGQVDIMLAHPASAGHGLNLQYGGNIMVWFGLTFSLELYQQFTKRLHRQGATKPVIMYRILCKDTYDYHVKDVLEGKRDTQNSLMQYLKAKLYGS